LSTSGHPGRTTRGRPIGPRLLLVAAPRCALGHRKLDTLRRLTTDGAEERSGEVHILPQTEWAVRAAPLGKLSPAPESRALYCYDVSFAGHFPSFHRCHPTLGFLCEDFQQSG
jgi:hypothetical protein